MCRSVCEGEDVCLSVCVCVDIYTVCVCACVRMHVCLSVYV